MNTFFLKLALVAPALLFPPLLGVQLRGEDWREFLHFPPYTPLIEPPAFSWPVFVIMGAIVLLALWPFVARALTCRQSSLNRFGTPARFPSFGWLGIVLIAVGWWLAWNRFGWFEPWQSHTYLPLWLGYILVVNGLCLRFSGRSPITEHPVTFALLFPASALFWWFFEYLNRFVGNWRYDIGIPLSGPDYVYYLSLAFSTVLPAVVSTTWLLRCRATLTAPYVRAWVVPPVALRRLAICGLPTAGAALVAVGLWPNIFYPFLWLAPLVCVWSIQRLYRADPLAPLERGDWRAIVIPAYAALLCGFFWELWNWLSVARWTYHIPYVQRFHLFEMPLLGYAGYLPFGIECLVATSLLAPRLAWPDDKVTSTPSDAPPRYS